MSRGGGDEWHRLDQGNNGIPVHFSGSSSRRSSGPADWQYNNRFPTTFLRQSTESYARFGATGTRRIEESVIATRNPQSVIGFALESYPPAPRTLNSMSRDTGPRMASFHRDPPPRLSWMQDSAHNVRGREVVKKTEDENAMKMLKKKIYGSEPKNLARRLSLYYSDHDRTNTSNRDKEADEDSKRCAVCLDDFEPGTEVMVTPCNHMFHGDCILPWMRSNGQCPVCRFVISQPTKSNEASVSSRNAPLAMMPIDDDDRLMSDQVLSIIVAMDEAFSWGRLR